jgi:hypothetical protein
MYIQSEARQDIAFHLPGAAGVWAPIGTIDRLGWVAGVDRIARYLIPALSGSQPN